MAYIISEDCMACGNCAKVCPSKAVIPDMECFSIDPDICESCGKCADYCPYGNIEEEE